MRVTPYRPMEILQMALCLVGCMLAVLIAETAPAASRYEALGHWTVACAAIVYIVHLTMGDLMDKEVRERRACLVREDPPA